MSIEIQCVGCGSHLRVGDEHAGKQARCPKCGSIQTIPGERVASSAAGELSAPPSETSAPSEPLSVSAPAPRVSEQPFASPASASPASAWPASAMPAPPPASLSDEWSLKTPDGREYGPVPRRELDAWVGEHRVSAQCRIRRGLGDWMPAAHLYPDLPAGTYQEINVAPAVATLPVTIYPETHRGGLILTLGILGLICTCPLLSIAAWVMGAKDLGKMKAGVMDPAGHDMTKVGYVLGAFWSLICILFATTVMLFVLAANS